MNTIELDLNLHPLVATYNTDWDYTIALFDKSKQPLNLSQVIPVRVPIFDVLNQVVGLFAIAFDDQSIAQNRGILKLRASPTTDRNSTPGYYQKDLPSKVYYQIELRSDNKKKLAYSASEIILLR